jgi:hypothetical protein
MTQLRLRCRCGNLQGTAIDVSPETGNHIVCYCDDCQAYARFLGQEGIVDAHGGTEIFQMTPSQIRIAAGDEHLCCLRLSEKGLMRWFAGCCRTPVGNTASSARVPFVGVPHSFIDRSESGRSLDDALGPIIGYANARFATGSLPKDVNSKVPLRLIARSVRLVAAAWLAGKSRPSPFFDASTHAPVVLPQVLTPAERDQLRPTAS